MVHMKPIMIYTMRTKDYTCSIGSLGEELLECRLVNDDVSDGSQTLAAGFLLFEQLPAAGNVARV